MTVASEQCVIVGVISTATWTIVFGEGAPREGEGVMWMSGRLMTDNCPRETGCSGSDIVEIRSIRIGQRLGNDGADEYVVMMMMMMMMMMMRKRTVYLLFINGVTVEVIFVRVEFRPRDSLQVIYGEGLREV
jgi:hypothetical protein